MNEHGANIVVGGEDLTRRGNLAIVGRLFNKNTGANLPYSETRLQEPPEGPLKIYYKNYKGGWIFLYYILRLGKVAILTKKALEEKKSSEDPYGWRIKTVLGITKCPIHCLTHRL